MVIHDSGLSQLYEGLMCQVWTGLDDSGQPVVVYVAGFAAVQPLLDTVERLRRTLLHVPEHP